MEFKHFAFLTVLICSLWSMVVSGLTSVDELGKIKMASELPQDESISNFGNVPIENNSDSIVKVLNTALPVAFLAILLLLITYGSNPIGLGSLAVAIVTFVFAYSKTMDAADIINASTNFSLDARVWWM